jgi:hypothetical protein
MAIFNSYVSHYQRVNHPLFATSTWPNGDGRPRWDLRSPGQAGNAGDASWAPWRQGRFPGLLARKSWEKLEKKHGKKNNDISSSG